MEASDIITALQNQRNGALNETAQLYAMLEAEKRAHEATKQELEKLKSQDSLTA